MVSLSMQSHAPPTHTLNPPLPALALVWDESDQQVRSAMTRVNDLTSAGRDPGWVTAGRLCVHRDYCITSHAHRSTPHSLVLI